MSNESFSTSNQQLPFRNLTAVDREEENLNKANNSTGIYNLNVPVSSISSNL
jgi:hypothetical protein